MKSSIITAMIFLVLFSLGCDNNNSHNCLLSVGEGNVSVVVIVPVSPNSEETTEEVATSDTNGNISVNAPENVPCNTIGLVIPGSPRPIR